MSWLEPSFPNHGERMYVATVRRVGISTGPQLPSQIASANRGQPRSVLRLRHGQHVAPPRLCPLGRSCLRPCLTPALSEQGRAPLVALGRFSSPGANTGGLHEHLLGACSAARRGMDHTGTPLHHSTALSCLCHSCPCAAPINERAF